MAERDIYQAISDTDIIMIDYDGSGNQLYIGTAAPGSATSDAVWRIKTILYTTAGGNTVQSAVLFADGSPAYHAVWDNRSLLSYS